MESVEKKDGILVNKDRRWNSCQKKIEDGIQSKKDRIWNSHIYNNTKTMPMCCSNIKQESGTAMCDHLDIAAEE